MNYLSRTFFYAFGFTLLLCAFGLDPLTSGLSDFLGLLHASVFWNIVGLFSIVLLGLDMATSGKFYTAIEVGCNVGRRIREDRSAAQKRGNS